MRLKAANGHGLRMVSLNFSLLELLLGCILISRQDSVAAPFAGQTYHQHSVERDIDTDAMNFDFKCGLSFGALVCCCWCGCGWCIMVERLLLLKFIDKGDFLFMSTTRLSGQKVACRQLTLVELMDRTAPAHIVTTTTTPTTTTPEFRQLFNSAH